MGLDITAYSETKLIETLPDIEAWEGKYYLVDNAEKTDFVYSGSFNVFPGAANGLTPNGVYRFKASFDFRAGSYSGYNTWREWLCLAVLKVEPRQVWGSPEFYEAKPFYWLINFSDCEGYIGPEKSAILSKDFADFQRAIDLLECDEYLKNKYADWRKAFDLAAKSGYVDFH